MKVLVPVDGSTYSQHAIRFIIRHFSEIQDKLQLTLFTAVEPLLPQQAAQIGHAKLDDYYENEANRAFEPARALLDSHHIPYETAYDTDWAPDAIAKRANSGTYALIVMGSRGLTEFKSLIFGSVTTNVLARTQVPLILIRGEHITGNTTRRIGIAIDDSQTAVDVMKFVATSQSLLGKAQYHLIHVVQDANKRLIHPATLARSIPFSEEEKKAVEDVQFSKAMKRVELDAQRLNGEIVQVKLVGNAADEMARYAQDNQLDMIVMGSHGRSSFATAFVGSVVCRLAAQGEMPLFIVR